MLFKMADLMMSLSGLKSKSSGLCKNWNFAFQSKLLSKQNRFTKKKYKSKSSSKPVDRILRFNTQCVTHSMEIFRGSELCTKGWWSLPGVRAPFPLRRKSTSQKNISFIKNKIYTILEIGSKAPKRFPVLHHLDLYK